ncbi:MULTISPECIES: hypothetical protein [unclassified Shewanella]|uniref:hypothetical protein n=1 Tax=unclassified Shewanella TaxID=196818 RepID=UPI0018E31A04|nr:MULTISPECIES: hypothetical protein [unclassified Shewanella]MBI1676964.1 hypothetical protein [Shewanella sp. DW31]MBW3530669.1 hypothetical protein [Shewanella sp. NKUCC06_TVS]
MGNAAYKRKMAAEHNARYVQRDAVRPKLTQVPGQKAEKKINLKPTEPEQKTPKRKGRFVSLLMAVFAAFMPASLRG